MRNFSVAVKRQGDSIKFLRKIVPGGVDESYGIEVAKLAGLPNKIINRAKELLEQLEAENKKARLAAEQMESDKISDSIVTDRLRKTNIDEMTDSELRDFVKDLLRYV